MGVQTGSSGKKASISFYRDGQDIARDRRDEHQPRQPRQYDRRGLGKTFGYSSENLLTSGPNSTTVSYDPGMRLYQVAGASTTRFAYDGADAIAEYNGSNTLQRRFVHGPGVDEPLVWYEGSGTTDRRFLHTDERGSVTAVSNSSGTVTNVNTYDEYGVPGTGNTGRFQYTGQKWITERALRLQGSHVPREGRRQIHAARPGRIWRRDEPLPGNGRRSGQFYRSYWHPHQQHYLPCRRSVQYQRYGP